MKLRLAKNEEKNIVLKLYEDARNEKFCVWNEEYPSLLEILQDLKANNLFVYVNDNEIIGAISIVPTNEMDDFLEWHYREKACEIARIVIATNHHGKGLAFSMIKDIFSICIEKGFTAIHLSCQCDNIPAIRTYQKLGFNNVGNKFMYNNNYYLLEKNLKYN